MIGLLTGVLLSFISMVVPFYYAVPVAVGIVGICFVTGFVTKISLLSCRIISPILHPHSTYQQSCIANPYYLTRLLIFLIRLVSIFSGRKRRFFQYFTEEGCIKGYGCFSNP